MKNETYSRKKYESLSAVIAIYTITGFLVAFASIAAMIAGCYLAASENTDRSNGIIMLAMGTIGLVISLFQIASGEIIEVFIDTAHYLADLNARSQKIESWIEKQSITAQSQPMPVAKESKQVPGDPDSTIDDETRRIFGL